MMAENRADAFLRIIRKAQRGRLKIYLGYAAGVGKTYQMLQEAHRLKNEGMDIVIGLVETHGRADIIRLMEGLEMVPRKKQEYRGIIIEEMDVDAILKRKPEIALIDELAHTNVPGSRNVKRYQDIQDILATGIHVISTLNIQHLESLCDVVEKISGIRVHERIPDSFLADADQIVNVDLTAEDLNERLKEGKIYPIERIKSALENFFRKSNLEQLRELTLRELASQIDLRSRDDPEDDVTSTPDQVMVCLSSRGPNSEKLLRYASRLAGKLNRNWYAIYVQTPPEEPTTIDAHTQRLLSSTLTLAKQLGAIVFTFTGEDIVKTILQFAKEYRVGHIVIGSPSKISLWRWLRGARSVAELLIREARGVSIVVLDTRQPELPTQSLEEKIVQEEAISKKMIVQNDHGSLRRYLQVKSIVIWKEPVKKDDVLQSLTEVALYNKNINDKSKWLEAIKEREDKGTTFFNEGVAFPHARIEGLEHSCMSMGLTHGGIAGVTTGKPIECVFLIFSPIDNPDEMIQILGLVSRAAQDKKLMEHLRLASKPDEAYTAILNWENTR